MNLGDTFELKQDERYTDYLSRIDQRETFQTDEQYKRDKYIEYARWYGVHIEPHTSQDNTGVGYRPGPRQATADLSRHHLWPKFKYERNNPKAISQSLSGQVNDMLSTLDSSVHLAASDPCDDWSVTGDLTLHLHKLQASTLKAPSRMRAILRRVLS